MARTLILPIEDIRWRTFVETCPEATPFHDPVWGGLLADCYGFRAFAVALVGANGELLAGLPLIEVRGLNRRVRWVGLPFTDALGPLGGAQHALELVDALEAKRIEAGVGTTEIRAEIGGGTSAVRGLGHTLALGSDANAVRATFHRSQVERGIVRSEREGVRVRAGHRAEDLLETFYSLHLLTRRRQGVPIQPRRFFRLLWERMLEPGLGTVLVAEADGRAVASAVFLNSTSTVVYKFGASDPGALDLRPNHAIFWEAVQRGCAAGANELDFGRTDLGHEGLRSFKAGWGTVEHPMVYTWLGKAPERGSGRATAALGSVIRRSPPLVCRVLGETFYRYAA